MRNTVKICLLLAIVFCFLTGCATGQQPVPHKLDKKISIGVASFMGNEATIMDNSFFTGSESIIPINGFSYDKYISSNLVAKLQKFGYKNSTVVKISENNPITQISRLGALFSLSNIGDKSINYVKEISTSKQYDVIITIVPNFVYWGTEADTNKHFKYGLDYSQKTVTNFAAYCAYVYETQTNKTLGHICNEVKTLSNSYSWPKKMSSNSPLMSSLTLWLKDGVYDDIQATTISLMRLN